MDSQRQDSIDFETEERVDPRDTKGSRVKIRSIKAGTILLSAAVLLFLTITVLAITGDLDNDGDVDRDDLNILLAAMDQAVGPGDPRDLDGDGTVTTLDGRKLVLLCTRALCQTEVDLPPRNRLPKST